jgi:hypothetical protein
MSALERRPLRVRREAVEVFIFEVDERENGCQQKC